MALYFLSKLPMNTNLIKIKTMLNPPVKYQKVCLFTFRKQTELLPLCMKSWKKWKYREQNQRRHEEMNMDLQRKRAPRLTFHLQGPTMPI